MSTPPSGPDADLQEAVDRANRLHVALGKLLESLSHDYTTDDIREAQAAWERDK